MRIKIILTILVLLGVNHCYAQKEISTRLGKVSRADVTLSAYKKDLILHNTIKQHQIYCGNKFYDNTLSKFKFEN